MELGWFPTRISRLIYGPPAGRVSPSVLADVAVILTDLCRLPGEPSCRASFGPQRNRPCPERLRDRGEVIT